MAAFHINAAGNPGRCTAQAGHCPFGSPAEHYPTPEAARAQYEQARGSVFLPPMTREESAIASLDDQLLAQALRMAQADSAEEVRAIEAETAPIAVIRAGLVAEAGVFNEPPD